MFLAAPVLTASDEWQEHISPMVSEQKMQKDIAATGKNPSIRLRLQNIDEGPEPNG